MYIVNTELFLAHPSSSSLLPHVTFVISSQSSLLDPLNHLHDYVVNVDSVEVFKKRLDKFWSNQPVKFDRSEFLVE